MTMPLQYNLLPYMEPDAPVMHPTIEELRSSMDADHALAIARVARAPKLTEAQINMIHTACDAAAVEDFGPDAGDSKIRKARRPRRQPVNVADSTPF